MPHREAHLTDEEIAYLRQLFREPGVEPAPDELKLVLPQGGWALSLLRGLTSELVATDGSYRLLFPVHLELGADGQPEALRLAHPSIVDQRGTERCARVSPRGDELRIRDTDGLLEGAEIRNVSSSGIALTASLPAEVRPGMSFDGLRLELPEAGDLSVKGRVVRTGPVRGEQRRLLALHFEDMEPCAESALRQYIFQRHRIIRGGPVSLN